MSGQSGVISGQGASPTQAAAQSPNTPDNPGNFVGIKQYLDANKNQSAKLGDQVSGVVSNSANEARDSVNLLNQDADQKIRGVDALGQDVKNKITNSAETLSEQERQQAKNTASARYSGPVDITGLGDSYNKASSAVSSANQKIGDTATEEGRMNLVKQVNTKPRTQGLDVFDNALLQAGGGREKLANVASQNQDLKNVMDTTTSNIQNRIGRADDPKTPNIDESSGAIGQTNKAQADAYKTIQDSLNNWTSAFTPKVSQAQQALVDQQNRVSQDIGDNPYGLDQGTMDLFGLSEGQRLFGLDLNQYLQTNSPSDINAANIASAEDYARYGALADLAGVESPLLNQENISNAGTAKTTPTVDKQRVQSDIAKALGAFNNKAATTTGSGSSGNYNSGGLGDEFWTNATANGTLSDYLAGKDPTYSFQYGMGLPSKGDKEAAQKIAQEKYASEMQRLLDQLGYNKTIKKN